MVDLTKIERPIVIYHDPCIDGWMAALLAKLRWPDAELIPQLHSDPFEGFLNSNRVVFHHEGEDFYFDDVRKRDVLIVDFSFPRGTLLNLHSEARSLLVLDHHTSAKKDLEGLDFCTFDMRRSGAGLALDYFFPNTRQDYFLRNHAIKTNLIMAVLAVEDCDLWQFKYEDSKAIVTYLKTLPKTLTAWNRLPRIAEIARQGSTMLRYNTHVIDSIARNAYEVEWPEGRLLVANSPVSKDEIGEILYNRAPPPLRTALIWYRHEDGFLACSLRTHAEGADASELAKKFGGGGHVHAAGFRCLDERSIVTGQP